METLLTLTEAIAETLGDGWRAERLDGDWRCRLQRGGHYVTVKAQHPGERRLILTAGTDAFSRARRWTGEPAPTITVAAARPAEVIAREIVRRLLPEAQRYWERQEEREARLVAYETATAATVQRLSTIGITFSEGTRYPTDSDVRLYAYLDALRIEAKVYGTPSTWISKACAPTWLWPCCRPCARLAKQRHHQPGQRSAPRPRRALLRNAPPASPRPPAACRGASNGCVIDTRLLPKSAASPARLNREAPHDDSARRGPPRPTPLVRCAKRAMEQGCTRPPPTDARSSWARQGPCA